MFLFLHYFNYQWDHENWAINPVMTALFSLVVAQALFKVKSTCKYEFTQASQDLRRHLIKMACLTILLSR